MTVAQLDATMSAKEFFKWIEYFKSEPQQADRLEMMLAQLTALMYNMNSKKPIKTMDFLISLDEDIKKSIKMEQMQKDLFADLDKLKRN